MFSMGDFVRHGRVSVRMLRHHDKVGLGSLDRRPWLPLGRLRP
jgi:hypothetical protein